MGSFRSSAFDGDTDVRFDSHDDNGRLRLSASGDVLRAQGCSFDLYFTVLAMSPQSTRARELPTTRVAIPKGFSIS